MTITVQIKRDNDSTGKVLNVYTKNAAMIGQPAACQAIAPGESAKFTLTAEQHLVLREQDAPEVDESVGDSD